MTHFEVKASLRAIGEEKPHTQLYLVCANTYDRAARAVQDYIASTTPNLADFEMLHIKTLRLDDCYTIPDHEEPANQFWRMTATATVLDTKGREKEVKLAAIFEARTFKEAAAQALIAYQHETTITALTRANYEAYIKAEGSDKSDNEQPEVTIRIGTFDDDRTVPLKEILP